MSNFPYISLSILIATIVVFLSWFSFQNSIKDDVSNNVLGKVDHFGPSSEITESHNINLSSLDGMFILSPTPLPATSSFPNLTQSPTPSLSSSPAKTNHNTIIPKDEYIFNQINTYRVESGKPPLEKHLEVCRFALLRALELRSDFSHEKFNERIKNNNLPYEDYTYMAENIAYNSSYLKVFDKWKNSSGHYQNLLADVKYACIASSGKYYAFESWTP